MSMRIALVVPSFLPQVGGAEFVVHHLACQWTRQWHQVLVLNCLSDKVTEPGADYAVRKFTLLRGATRFGYHRFPFAWHARKKLQRLLYAFNPDFISAHMAYPTAIWLSGLRPKQNFIVTCHGADITPYEYDGYRSLFNIDKVLVKALNQAKGVIALSRYARGLLQEMGVQSDRILDIPNGVDIERFQKRVECDIRAKLGLPAHALMIISVGRNNPAKAYDTGIRAFAKVLAKIPSAYYIILGKGVEQWNSLAEKLNINSHVMLLPGLYGDDLVAAYQQADIFFSPSIEEMFPLVVLEAMAAGLPCVVTDISGNQDAVENGSNGILVQPGQPDEMANALISLLSNKSLRIAMGTDGRDKSSQFSWERISQLYLEHRY